MTAVGRLAVAAISAVVLIAAGCSRAPEESPAAGPSVPESAAPTPAPAATRPLSDFLEESPSGPQYSFHSFGTPSGRIQCRSVDGTFACQTGGHPHTVADSALCGFYPGLEQGRTQRFDFFPDAPQPCATIIQGDGFDSPHTLAYGQSVTAGLSSGRTVTCTSAADGLTCIQVGGIGPRGFFLSVDSFEVL